MSSSARSVSKAIKGVTLRDPAAQEKLWKAYFKRLTRLARGKLGRRRLPAGSEDVAQDALASFFRGAEAGRFPQLSDRDDLWRLLVVIANRKASRVIRAELRQKRGGGKVISAEAQAERDSEDEAILDRVISREPTPEEATLVAEEYALLLEKLERQSLRDVAEWKIEGWTIEEIAKKLGRSTKTVERKLNTIRTILQQGAS